MTNGFTLWFTGLSGAGKSTIADLVGRLEERGGLSSTSMATSCARISRRASAFRRKTGTRTSSALAGSPRG